MQRSDRTGKARTFFLGSEGPNHDGSRRHTRSQKRFSLPIKTFWNIWELPEKKDTKNHLLNQGNNLIPGAFPRHSRNSAKICRVGIFRQFSRTQIYVLQRHGMCCASHGWVAG